MSADAFPSSSQTSASELLIRINLITFWSSAAANINSTKAPIFYIIDWAILARCIIALMPSQALIRLSGSERSPVQIPKKAMTIHSGRVQLSSKRSGEHSNDFHSIISSSLSRNKPQLDLHLRSSPLSFCRWICQFGFNSNVKILIRNKISRNRLIFWSIDLRS